MKGFIVKIQNSKSLRLFDLSGQVAIVTGAAQGLGRATAEGLADAGVSVVLADINEGQLQSVAEAIESRSQSSLAVATDLGRSDELSHLVNRAIQEFGRIDVLVNCAGITVSAPSEEYPDEAWEASFLINVTAAFKLSKLVAKHMIKQRSGNIINVTSIGAAQGFPNNPAYQASKGALQQLTRALACDWAKYNIRVNNLCPGHFKAPMTQKSYANPELRESRERRCMLLRWGEPEEIVGPVIFLASAASSYMTGNDLFIDGGFTKTGLTENT
jgi:NAD(P)-dependent dehydrogenase (short-subunit alcohol dehydrogenase family)